MTRQNMPIGRASCGYLSPAAARIGWWVIILKHGNGRGWSIFYGELLPMLFDQVARREAAAEARENQIVARFALLGVPRVAAPSAP